MKFFPSLLQNWAFSLIESPTATNAWPYVFLKMKFIPRNIDRRDFVVSPSNQRTQPVLADEFHQIQSYNKEAALALAALL